VCIAQSGTSATVRQAIVDPKEFSHW